MPTRFFLAALILCWLLSAGRAPAGTGDVVPEDAPEALQFLREPWTGDLDGMIPRRHIRVLVTASRTDFFLDGAAQHGLTADAFHEFETFLNARLKTGKTPIHVVFVPTRRDLLLPALTGGLGDVAAAALSVTPSRLEQADFCTPLATGINEVLVEGPASPPVERLEDLSGQTVYLRRSSSYYESVQALNERLAAQGRDPVVVQEADENLEDEDILEMLGAGLVPLTVVDRYLADLWAQVLPDIRVRQDLQVGRDRSIAWAVRKDSPRLKETLDVFVAQAHASRLGRSLGRKYYSDAGYLKNPTASEDMSRFNRAVGFFKKYGDKYDMDYLLVAAQAYQESRLDQGARSPQGAVGVMQILPATAAKPPISLPGIEDLETNIHAGVKYHRFMMDTQYNDPAIDPVDRMLFAFAAYNAGPAAVAKMRRLAADMGLDPNTWFSHVEIAAGKVVGQGVVRYVSNIYKYYVAYRLVTARAEEKRLSRTGGEDR